MEIRVNKKKYEVPFDLNVITLAQYLEYYDKYGRELDKDLEKIQKKDYGSILKENGLEVTKDNLDFYKGLDLDSFMSREALGWFSYWTGIDFFQVDEMLTEPLLFEYMLFRHVTLESAKAAERFPLEVEWAGAEWQIQDYKVTPAGTITTGELITAKEVIRQVYNIGKKKWDAMPYLCCVFFRKKEEPYSDELVANEGERMKQMMSLPMTHVLQVAFFLNCYVSIWSVISRYSLPAEAEILNPN